MVQGTRLAPDIAAPVLEMTCLKAALTRKDP